MPDQAQLRFRPSAWIGCEEPLTSDEKDPGGHCCPDWKGCNMPRGYQACHLLSIESHTDELAKDACRYWWRRWQSLPWWKFSMRREALRKMRQERDLALASPMRPPPPPPRGLPPKPGLKIVR